MKKIAALLMALLLMGSSAMAVQPGFTVYHGDRADKRICITVDDCKDTSMVVAIFDLCRELDIPITYFVLGYVLQDEDRDVWRAIAQSDCEIGNHTYWHNGLGGMSRQGIAAALGKTQTRLDEVLGFHYPMQVMRPPFGEIRNAQGKSGPVLDGIEKAGYSHAVLWDVSQTNPDKCYYDVQNGSILLFHTMRADYACLQQLLPRLKADGYEFVTVSEMLGMPPVRFTLPQE